MALPRSSASTDEVGRNDNVGNAVGDRGRECSGEEGRDEGCLATLLVSNNDYSNIDHPLLLL